MNIIRIIKSIIIASALSLCVETAVAAKVVFTGAVDEVSNGIVKIEVPVVDLIFTGFELSLNFFSEIQGVHLLGFPLAIRKSDPDLE